MALPLGGGAMVAALENQDLYGLPFQIAARPIQYFLRRAQLGAALRGNNMEALFVVRIPTQGTFTAQMDAVVDLVWRLLPARWKPASSLKMSYSFHPDNPKLNAAGNRGDITYSQPDFETYKMKTVQLSSRNFAVKQAETDVRNIRDIDSLVRWWLVDRADLKEDYDNVADEHMQTGDPTANTGYVRPDYAHFRFYTLRMIREEPTGSKLSYLINKRYQDFPDSQPGDCVFRVIYETFSKGRNCPLRLTIPEMRARCLIPEGGVTWNDFPAIETHLMRETPLTKTGNSERMRWRWALVLWSLITA